MNLILCTMIFKQMTSHRPMTKRSHYNYFLILTGLVLLTHVQRSRGAHFFEHNQQCHCHPDKPCNGTCTPDRCAGDYIGVTCQHVSFVSIMDQNDRKQLPTELTDGIDSTCTTKKENAVFQVDLPRHFVWIYVYRKNTKSMKPNLALYRDGVDLKIEFHFLILNENSLLIKSCEDVLFDKLELSNIPEDTCSVEISIGRNLANFSTAWTRSMSSNSTTIPPQIYKASDGDDGTEFKLLGPIKTGQGDAWRTRFKHDAKVNQIRVKYRVYNQFWWNSCRVQMYAPNTSLIHTASGATRKGVKEEVVIDEVVDELIREVEIFFPNNPQAPASAQKDNKIYEVYIYGEFRCPSGKCGVLCEKSCPEGCNPAMCDPDWGCSDGCSRSWIGHQCTQKCRFQYGPNCEHPCSDECADVGDCDPHTGDCIHGCKVGYYPPNCTVPCHPGTYDVNCSKTCIQCRRNRTTKKHACNHFSGECLLGCQLGYFGNHCAPLLNIGSLGIHHVFFLIGFLLVIWYSYTHYEDDEEALVEEAKKNKGQITQEGTELVLMGGVEGGPPQDNLLSSKNPENGEPEQISVNQFLSEPNLETLIGAQMSSPEPVEDVIGTNISSLAQESKEKVQQSPIDQNRGNLVGAQLSSSEAEPKENVQGLPNELNPM